MVFFSARKDQHIRIKPLALSQRAYLRFALPKTSIQFADFPLAMNKSERSIDCRDSIGGRRRKAKRLRLFSR